MSLRARTLLAAVLATVLAASQPRGGEAGLAGASHLRHTGEVRALCRTGDTLWVGTGGGIFLYDLGARSVVAHLTAGRFLPSSSVRAIRTKGDSVLVGTDRGLVVFAPAETTASTAASHAKAYKTVPFDDIAAIDLGRERIYLSTRGHGVGVIAGDEGWGLTRADSLLDDTAFGVAEAADSTVWFATAAGLCAYRDSVWVSFRAGAGIPRGEVRALVPSREPERYFLHVAGYGVYAFDGEQSKRVTKSGLLPADAVSAIAVDSLGHLWVAGRYGGIAVYQNGYWTAVHEADASVATQPWTCAYASPQGVVYFGGRDGTVLSVEDTRIDRLRVPIGLAAPDARGFTAVPGGGVWFMSGARVLRADSTGTIIDDGGPDGVNGLAVSPSGEPWVAARWGVYRRSAKGWTSFAVDTRERDPAFVSICWDHRGDLWVALRSGAIYRRDSRLWMRMADPLELLDGPADALVSDGRDAVWAVGGTRCARFAAGRWRVFPPDSFAGEFVRDVAPTRRGAVVATASGLWEIDGDSPRRLEFSVVRGRGLGGAHEARCVAVDAAGRCYVGTTAGVLVVGGEAARWHGSEVGLGEAVADVFIDSNRRLWVGFERDGVARVPLESLW